MKVIKDKVAKISFVVLLLLLTYAYFYAPEIEQIEELIDDISYSLEECNNTTITLDVYVAMKEENKNGAYFKVISKCPNNNIADEKEIRIDGPIENLILKVNGKEIKI